MKNIIATILIIGSAAIFFGFINGEYKHIGEQRAQAAEYGQALDNAKNLRTERDDLLKRYNSLNPDSVTRLTKLLPDGVDNVKLISYMNNVASRYNMTIKDIKVGQPNAANVTGQFAQDKSPYGSLIISFSVNSSYENFLLFLKDVEKSLRLVDLTSLSFSVNKDSSYNFNVSLQTYWLK